MKDDERPGHFFTVYPIQIQRSNPAGSPPSHWIVFRRYSEFEALHAKLKSLFPALSQYEFPNKIMFKGMLQAKKQLIDNRRKGLEKYLQVRCALYGFLPISF